MLSRSCDELRLVRTQLFLKIQCSVEKGSRQKKIKEGGWF